MKPYTRVTWVPAASKTPRVEPEAQEPEVLPEITVDDLDFDVPFPDAGAVDVVPAPEDYVDTWPMEEYVDRSMVGNLILRTAHNTSSAVWRDCYPGAFWVANGLRLDAPMSKAECIGDIRPGTQRDFRVVVPRFPLIEKPHFLRIAILENGRGWHTIDDVVVR